ncbi:hypothetical protein J5X84_12685 [Streptosporangiaceae bacterium NEAU-GS5]|nr:hypothetical protein [Streptosporangiaceae bacterium NEAU-GS5]
MKDSIRVGLAIAAGYYLGRRHKLRLAAVLAAAGAAGRLRKGEGGMLGKALKTLGASPELEQVVDRLRGNLTEVGKAAAVAATSRQIDTVSSKLHDRAEALRSPGKSGGDDEEAPEQEDESREPAADTGKQPDGDEDAKPSREPQAAGKGRG